MPYKIILLFRPNLILLINPLTFAVAVSLLIFLPVCYQVLNVFPEHPDIVHSIEYLIPDIERLLELFIRH